MFFSHPKISLFYVLDRSVSLLASIIVLFLGIAHKCRPVAEIRNCGAIGPGNTTSLDKNEDTPPDKKGVHVLGWPEEETSPEGGEGQASGSGHQPDRIQPKDLKDDIFILLKDGKPVVEISQQKKVLVGGTLACIIQAHIRASLPQATTVFTVLNGLGLTTIAHAFHKVSSEDDGFFEISNRIIRETDVTFSFYLKDGNSVEYIQAAQIYPAAIITDSVFQSDEGQDKRSRNHIFVSGYNFEDNKYTKPINFLNTLFNFLASRESVPVERKVILTFVEEAASTQVHYIKAVRDALIQLGNPYFQYVRLTSAKDLLETAGAALPLEEIPPKEPFWSSTQKGLDAYDTTFDPATTFRVETRLAPLLKSVLRLFDSLHLRINFERQRTNMELYELKVELGLLRAELAELKAERSQASASGSNTGIQPYRPQNSPPSRELDEAGIHSPRESRKAPASYSTTKEKELRAPPQPSQAPKVEPDEIRRPRMFKMNGGSSPSVDHSGGAGTLSNRNLASSKKSKKSGFWSLAGSSTGDMSVNQVPSRERKFALEALKIALSTFCISELRNLEESIETFSMKQTTLAERMHFILERYEKLDGMSSLSPDKDEVVEEKFAMRNRCAQKLTALAEPGFTPRERAVKPAYRASCPAP